MFNKLFCMIKNPKNNVHTFVKVALPAVESQDKDGNYKIIADPKLDAQSILDVLAKYWDNSDICNLMLTRFIRVVCDTSIRNYLAEYATVTLMLRKMQSTKPVKHTLMPAGMSI